MEVKGKVEARATHKFKGGVIPAKQKLVKTMILESVLNLPKITTPQTVSSVSPSPLSPKYKTETYIRSKTDPKTGKEISGQADEEERVAVLQRFKHKKRGGLIPAKRKLVKTMIYESTRRFIASFCGPHVGNKTKIVPSS